MLAARFPHKRGDIILGGDDDDDDDGGWMVEWCSASIYAHHLYRYRANGEERKQGRLAMEAIIVVGVECHCVRFHCTANNKCTTQNRHAASQASTNNIGINEGGRGEKCEN